VPNAHVGSEHSKAAMTALPKAVESGPKIVSQTVDATDWSLMGEMMCSVAEHNALVDIPLTADPLVIRDWSVDDADAALACTAGPRSPGG
jgi:hypothetical protein